MQKVEMTEGLRDQEQVVLGEKHVRRFLANCRFVRQFLGKKVPKNAIVSHAKATREIAFFIGHDYIIDNNPSIDYVAVASNLEYRQNYLRNVITHMPSNVYLQEKGVKLEIYSDGRAKIKYRNGDEIVSHYAEFCKGNPLSFVSDMVAVELSAKKSIEDLEAVLRVNQHVYDPKRCDKAIQIVMIARALAQGIIDIANPAIDIVMKEAGLSINKNDIVNLFGDRPFVLGDYVLNDDKRFNELYGEVVQETIKSDVFEQDTIAEQTGAFPIAEHLGDARF